MADKLHFSLVSPARELFSGEVDHVIAPGTDGEFGVLAHHAPFMTTLKNGVVRVLEGDTVKMRIFVRGGFADVTSAGLTILAEEGIRFTVLSPYQAAEVLGEDGEWIDVSGGGIDTRVPYRVDLPDNNSMAVFFYDGPLSMEIAFNGILDDGHLFADALIRGLGEDAAGPVLARVSAVASPLA